MLVKKFFFNYLPLVIRNQDISLSNKFPQNLLLSESENGIWLEVFNLKWRLFIWTTLMACILPLCICECLCVERRICVIETIFSGAHIFFDISIILNAIRNIMSCAITIRSHPTFSFYLVQFDCYTHSTLKFSHPLLFYYLSQAIAMNEVFIIFYLIVCISMHAILLKTEGRSERENALQSLTLQLDIIRFNRTINSSFLEDRKEKCHRNRKHTHTQLCSIVWWCRVWCCCFMLGIVSLYALAFVQCSFLLFQNWLFCPVCVRADERSHISNMMNRETMPQHWCQKWCCWCFEEHCAVIYDSIIYSCVVCWHFFSLFLSCSLLFFG